jgi:hypothetical protein
MFARSALTVTRDDGSIGPQTNSMCAHPNVGGNMLHWLTFGREDNGGNYVNIIRAFR